MGEADLDGVLLGVHGEVVVALLSAFMSTISTMFNWGSSYLVNDVYKRFVVTGGSQPHYVKVARVLTLLLAVAGLLETPILAEELTSAFPPQSLPPSGPGQAPPPGPAP